ncbi:MAG: leucine-rich repeat domain-containing protein [Bacteroidaceae bacterium]|nr:leucine-rich repeat domain-containing protein [Bacteroidaceae bacterium]
MKELKYIILFCAALIAASCTKDDFGGKDALTSFSQISVGMADLTTTRTHLGENNKMFWNKQESIGIYSDVQDVELYTLNQSDGENASFTGNTVKGNKFYAFYPYREGAIDKDNKKILHMRLNNGWVNNEQSRLPMVATSSTNSFLFKQVVGIIKISLTGDSYISSVSIWGNNKEYISGSGIIDISENTPLFRIDETSKEIHSLNSCIFNSYLDKDTPTEFYFPVPVMTFEEGFTVSIIGKRADSNEDFTLEKKTHEPVVISRAIIKSFSSLDTDELLQAEDDQKVLERDALIALYNSTDGANWIHNDNWGTDLPLDEWYGVSIDERGHVYSIGLAENNLTGTIPESIGNLGNLDNLYLNDNQLTGDIPESIGNLVNLTRLYLYNNQLTGGIPESIGNLGNLTRLYLDNNQLTGGIPESIGNLGNLDNLYLNDNQLTGDIPESIGNLVNLTRLYLYNNQLTGGIPESIGNLGNLTRLYLYNNQLTGDIPESIGNLVNLSYLYLMNNQLTGGIPDSFMNLAKLEDFAFYLNRMDGTLSETLLKSEWWAKIDRNNLRQQDGYKLKYGWLYESTDFSQDGKVTILQQHQKGNGIKIVITAEGFSDRMVNDGTFDAATKWAMEAFFNVEPYTTFRDYFDVYSVAAISKNEMIGEDVVFGTKNGNAGEGYQTNHETIIEYVKKVTDLNDDLSNVTTIAILNNDNAYSRAYCSMYSNGFSIGITEYGSDGALQHEVGGHGFGKLADEYTYDDKTSSAVFTDTEWLHSIHESGQYLNIDTNSDKTKVLWKDFIANPDYEVENLGIYEGALGSYSKGIYRATPNSMMSDGYGDFNAPSRWAIYERIKRLAGENYSFESFLEYDKKNLEAIAAKATTRNYVEKLPESKVQRGAPPVFHNYPSSEIGRH